MQSFNYHFGVRAIGRHTDFPDIKWISKHIEITTFCNRWKQTLTDSTWSLHSLCHLLKCLAHHLCFWLVYFGMGIMLVYPYILIASRCFVSAMSLHTLLVSTFFCSARNFLVLSMSHTAIHPHQHAPFRTTEINWRFNSVNFDSHFIYKLTLVRKGKFDVS